MAAQCAISRVQPHAHAREPPPLLPLSRDKELAKRVEMSSFAPASKRARVEANFDYPPGREFFPGKFIMQCETTILASRSNASLVTVCPCIKLGGWARDYA